MTDFKKYIDGILGGMSQEKFNEICGVETEQSIDDLEKDYLISAIVVGIIFVILLIVAIFMALNTISKVRQQKSKGGLDENLTKA